MIPFNKPPLTIQEHLKLLKDRGLVIECDQSAEDFMQHITYYHLCSYWLPFEEPCESQPRTHQFKTGTTFDQIKNLYEFDRDLRMLVLNAIERIEISVRSKWVNVMKHAYGPHAQLIPHAFVKHRGEWKYRTGLQKWIDTANDSRETFVKHFKDKYKEDMPPIWAAAELLSFGSFSRWYKFTKAPEMRNRVAKQYKLDEKILVSFIHHLCIIRNHCAHHSRLWNRNISIPFIIPSQGNGDLIDSLIEYSDPTVSKRTYKIYNTLTMSAYLTHQIEGGWSWRARLKDLIKSYDIDLRAMGFPKDWLNRPIWNTDDIG